VSIAISLTIGISNNPIDSKSISEKSFTIEHVVENIIKLRIANILMIIPIEVLLIINKII
jgi:hypothetical protein